VAGIPYQETILPTPTRKSTVFPKMSQRHAIPCKCAIARCCCENTSSGHNNVTTVAGFRSHIRQQRSGMCYSRRGVCHGGAAMLAQGCAVADAVSRVGQGLATRRNLAVRSQGQRAGPVARFRCTGGVSVQLIDQRLTRVADCTTGLLTDC
jgi:hypothetical protein